MNYVFMASIAEMLNAACDILEIVGEIRQESPDDSKITEFEKKTLELVWQAIALYMHTHEE